MISGYFGEKKGSPPLGRGFTPMEFLDWPGKTVDYMRAHRGKFGDLQNFAKRSVSGARLGVFLMFWALSGMVDFTDRSGTFRFFLKPALHAETGDFWRIKTRLTLKNGHFY